MDVLLLSAKLYLILQFMYFGQVIYQGIQIIFLKLCPLIN